MRRVISFARSSGVADKTVSLMVRTVFPSTTTGAGGSFAGAWTAAGAGFEGAFAAGAEGAGTAGASFGGAAVAAVETSPISNAMMKVLRHVIGSPPCPPAGPFPT